MTLEYEYIPTIEAVAKQIADCEGVHTQQAVYSTFHGALTQVCYGCLKIRSTIYRAATRSDTPEKKVSFECTSPDGTCAHYFTTDKQPNFCQWCREIANTRISDYPNLTNDPKLELTELYNELIMAVSDKYAGETRHQTALRYIRQAEQGNDTPMTQLNPNKDTL